MGIIQRDLEEKISDKADEIAEQRYGMEFSDLPASLQMQVWMDAEQEEKDTVACQADAIYDRMKENGHKPEQRVICWKCDAGMTKTSMYDPLCNFVGGTRECRRNGTLGEWWVCTNPSCEDGQKNNHSIENSLLPD